MLYNVIAVMAHNYALYTLTYSKESEMDDATHFRESFMEVIDDIDD